MLKKTLNNLKSQASGYKQLESCEEIWYFFYFLSDFSVK